MSIADKIMRAKNDYDAVYEAGKKSEYDRFWDEFQQNGNRASYRGSFGGGGWNPKTFNPKYPIKPITSTAIYMFVFCNWGASENLDYRNYKHLFDFSEVTLGTNVFQDAWIDYIEVDFSNATSLISTFSESYSAGHKTHITLKVSEKCTNYNSAFNTCTALTHLFFADGSVIAGNVDVSSCPLVAESLVSVVEHLSGTASSKTLTVKQSAINNADWSTTNYASWEELKATKPNWGFAYK